MKMNIVFLFLIMASINLRAGEEKERAEQQQFRIFDKKNDDYKTLLKNEQTIRDAMEAAHMPNVTTAVIKFIENVRSGRYPINSDSVSDVIKIIRPQILQDQIQALEKLLADVQVAENRQ